MKIWFYLKPSNVILLIKIKGLSGLSITRPNISRTEVWNIIISPNLDLNKFLFCSCFLLIHFNIVVFSVILSFGWLKCRGHCSQIWNFMFANKYCQKDLPRNSSIWAIIWRLIVSMCCRKSLWLLVLGPGSDSSNIVTSRTLGSEIN